MMAVIGVQHNDYEGFYCTTHITCTPCRSTFFVRSRCLIRLTFDACYRMRPVNIEYGYTHPSEVEHTEFHEVVLADSAVLYKTTDQHIVQTNQWTCSYNASQLTSTCMSVLRVDGSID